MLAELLQQRIKQNGPLTLYDYMSLCLYHPQEGYYMHQVPIGTRGDFITAPEISQIFGEIIGAYLLQHTINHLNQTTPTLIECGPGKGTLMQDILKVWQLRPNLLQQTSIKLLEISPTLKSSQQEILHNYAVEWYTDLESLLKKTAPQPIVLIANEFMDALPTDQYTYKNNMWHKRYVGLENDAFIFYWVPCDHIPRPWPEAETIYEYAPDAPRLMEYISKYIKKHQGIAMIIDYGYAKGTGDSLQGLRSHAYSSALHHHGTTDLTTHVNFGLLKEVAEAQGCSATLVTQSTFLSQQGIHLRAQQLQREASLETQTTLQRQVDYLTKKMGEIFKVLVVQNPA